MIGSIIKAKRKKLGISQLDLAERLGVTQAYIAMIENEKASIPEKLIPKLCKHLKLRKKVFPKKEVKQKLFIGPPEHIGDLLKEYRLRNNMTCEQMGLYLCTAKSVISEYERRYARVPDMKIFRISKKIDIDQFILHDFNKGPLKCKKK